MRTACLFGTSVRRWGPKISEIPLRIPTVALEICQQVSTANEPEDFTVSFGPDLWSSPGLFFGTWTGGISEQGQDLFSSCLGFGPQVFWFLLGFPLSHPRDLWAPGQAPRWCQETATNWTRGAFPKCDIQEGDLIGGFVTGGGGGGGGGVGVGGGGEVVGGNKATRL